MIEEAIKEQRGEIGIVQVKKFRMFGHLLDIDSRHDGKHMFTGTFHELVPVLDSSGQFYKTGLSAEEELSLEKEMHLKEGTLSRWNKDYWSKFIIRIPRNGLILHPDESARDFITYRCLQEDFLVANSEAEKLESARAEYVITSKDQEAKMLAVKGRTKRNAFTRFNKMSTKDMVQYLRGTGKSVTGTESVDYIETEMLKIIESNAKGFLDVVDNPLYKERAFVTQCVMKGIITKRSGKYTIIGVDTVFYNIDDLVAFLGDPANQELKGGLLNKLEAGA